VTPQPLTPVIPSSGGLAARRWSRSAAGRPLPLARPVPVPAAPQDVVYGIGRIDASGRIADRAVISALGWADGDRLTLTADAGIVTARRDPGGMVTLPARAYIAVPARLRRRCGLRAGDRVLLAAVPGDATLTAYCLAVVDQAIRAAYGSFPHAQGAQP
jgi:bifunctional DNA-binding transcriptional regulator/antitoxin component of YhaV-PrlF toxin-antitoxin module